MGKIDTTPLADRMKNAYEHRNRTYLTRRTPVIIRLDMKAAHTLTKKFEKPYDEQFIQIMQETALYLKNNIQGCKAAYVQSDEISLLLCDFDTYETSAWFDYNVQKIVSVAASMATAFFNKNFNRCVSLKSKAPDNALPMFDARCFNLPENEVQNYFVWRQQDWLRNSVQMLAQANYSAKQLHKKSQKDMKQMLILDKGIDWDNQRNYLKYGTLYIKPLTEQLKQKYPESETIPYCELIQGTDLFEILLDDVRKEK